jgi:putative peptidoglycan lipid II flippase
MSRLVKQSLLAGSVIMIGTNLFTRLFGFMREAVIADRFGTSATLDTFVLAFTIPELLSFIIFAAVPSALIPIRNRLIRENEAAESTLFWNGTLAYTAVLGLISILLFFSRAQILHWLAPTLGPVEQAEGVMLSTILVWFFFFRGLEAYFRGWLFARKHFIVPATSAMIINIVVLAAIFLLYGRYDIASLAWGWLLGSIVIFLYNGVFALIVIKPRWTFHINSELIKGLLKATAFVAIVESIALVYPVVDRWLAARYLGEGQISALRYAIFLIHIPTGIFVVTFASTSFPWIADLTGGEQRERLASLYRQSVRLLIFAMLLIAAACALFSSELVRVAFARGAFDAVSEALTASPLIYYALGIVFYSIYVFQMRFYYARLLLLRLAFILGLMLVLKIVLSAWLVGPMQQDGLALATSLTWLVTALIMSLDLAKALGESVSSIFFRPLPKVLAALAFPIGVWLITMRFWPVRPEWSLWQTFAYLAATVTVGATAYLIVALLLGLPEPKRMVEMFRSKIKPSRTAGEL